MKILHVVTGMDPQLGGVCQAIRTTIKGLTGLGIENEVLCLDSPDSEFIKNDPFIIHAIGPAQKPWAYNSNLKSWLLDNSLNFDKVIVHGLWQYHSYITGKTIVRLGKAKKESVPEVFVMPHGMLDPYFQKAKSRKFKAIRNWFYWKLIEKNSINNANGVLFTCQEEMELAREPFIPYQPKKEIIVGLGVEEPPLRNEKMHQAFLDKCRQVANQPYFLFLSRIDEKKGVDMMFKSYLKLLIEYHNQKSLPKLVVAGPGLESFYGKQMQEFVIKNGLQDHIFFPGMLKGDAKWGAFYNCEAFILPSHQENFGIAVVESLACGKPVLISNKVNIWKEIAASEAGLIANDDQKGTDELLKKWLLLSDERKINLANNARQVFEKYYALEPSVIRLLNALNT